MPMDSLYMLSFILKAVGDHYNLKEGTTNYYYYFFLQEKDKFSFALRLLWSQFEERLEDKILHVGRARLDNYIHSVNKP